MTKDRSGPAFPVPAELCQDLTIEEQRGMTLRDYFAAKAMQGLLDAAMAECEIAKAAYEMADAMLKARQA